MSYWVEACGQLKPLLASSAAIEKNLPICLALRSKASETEEIFRIAAVALGALALVVAVFALMLGPAAWIPAVIFCGVASLTSFECWQFSAMFFAIGDIMREASRCHLFMTSKLASYLQARVDEEPIAWANSFYFLDSLLASAIQGEDRKGYPGLFFWPLQPAAPARSTIH